MVGSGSERERRSSGLLANPLRVLGGCMDPSTKDEKDARRGCRGQNIPFSIHLWREGGQTPAGKLKVFPDS